MTSSWGEKGSGSLKESKEVTGRAARRPGVAGDCDSMVGSLFKEHLSGNLNSEDKRASPKSREQTVTGADAGPPSSGPSCNDGHGLHRAVL